MASEHPNPSTGETGSPDPARQGRGWLQRLPVLALGLVLAIISVWCVGLLLRSVDLRRELDRQRGRLDELQRVRRQLEVLPGDGAAAGRVLPELDRLRRSLDGWADGGGAELAAPVQQLDDRLDELQRVLDPSSSGPPAAGDPSREDALWDASSRVLRAAGELETRLTGRVAGLHRRLEGHWSSLNLLVVVCLLLCASNLGLLYLTQRRRHELELARDHALEMATQDPLTGLLNRDAILRVLDQELARAQRLHVPLGLILADVDGFRRINELLGQQRGDDVLQEISRRLVSLVRPYDTLGRLEGDAFLVVLPTCDEAATASVAERLRQAVAGEEVNHGLGRLRVSVSLAHGTVEQADEETGSDLLLHRLWERLGHERGRRPADRSR